MSFIKEKSEFGDLSVNADVQNSTELVNPFLNLFFRVRLGASESSVSNKLGDRAGLKGLLSAADFDIDGDSSLMTWPVLSGNSDSIAEFVDGCGS